MNYDVGVIGGGVIGLACAWRMAQAGARVAVFERGQIGREASWAAAAMVGSLWVMAHDPPDGWNTTALAAMFELCLHSRALYPAFADELLDVTGVDVELSLRGHSRRDWRTPGILYISTRGDDLTGEGLQQQAEQGLNAERKLPGTLGTTRFGEQARLRDNYAFWLPDEGQVENRKLAEALRASAVRAGVIIRQSLPVRRVVVEDNRVTQLLTTHGAETCDNVLLCAGAWSSRIHDLPPECVPPVRPVAGQLVSLEPTKQIKRMGAPLPYVTYSSDVYLVPRRDHRLVVGATVEEIGFKKRVTVQGATKLLSAACALMPELERYTIEAQWAGLRPATPDALPILGKTSLDNLFVATGHFRNGILLTPITAQLMTDYVLNGVEPLSDFGIERFAAQTTKAEQTICVSG